MASLKTSAAGSPDDGVITSAATCECPECTRTLRDKAIELAGYVKYLAAYTRTLASDCRQRLS